MIIGLGPTIIKPPLIQPKGSRKFLRPPAYGFKHWILMKIKECFAILRQKVRSKPFLFYQFRIISIYLTVSWVVKQMKFIYWFNCHTWTKPKGKSLSVSPPELVLNCDLQSFIIAGNVQLYVFGLPAFASPGNNCFHFSF